MPQGDAVGFVVFIQHEVKNLINQTKRAYLPRSNVRGWVCSIRPHLIHLVGKITGSLEVGKNNIAVIGEEKLIELVLISSRTRDVEFHRE